MDNTRYLPLPERPEPPVARIRWLLAAFFRQRRLLAWSFFAILAGVTVATVISTKYQAEAKIIIRRERLDPLVSADSNSQPRVSSALSDQEVNSEVDLLQSNDLLEKVVLATGLADGPDSWSGKVMARLAFWKTAEELRQQRVATEVQKLAKHLEVDPPNKSNVFRLAYENADPATSARVLNKLVELYLQKHLEVHRSAGTVDFFQRQAEQHKQELDRLQTELLEFNRREGVVDPQQQEQSTLDKLAQFEAAQKDLQASIAETEQRIGSLQAQKRSTPTRTTTQVRVRSDVVAQLNTNLYQLEQQRSAMLTKYEPTYRAVVDLDQQIADARAAIEQAKKTPIQDEVTDQNPTYQWLDSDLAQSRSQLAAQKARLAATTRTIEAYKEKAQDLDKKGVAQQDLVRAAKTAEQNYLLYRQKQEEARTAAALDQQRILNVAVAESAIIPALPESPLWMRLAAGCLLAGLLSMGLAFARDYWDPLFRTPDELRLCLNLPVLAAIPSPLLLKSGGPGMGLPDPAER